MASKLQKLQATASQASQFVSSRGTNYYKQLLEQNKQHIQEPPTVEKCNLLAKQLFYTRLARTLEPAVLLSLKQLLQRFPNPSLGSEHNVLKKNTANIPSRNESFWKELDYAKNLWKNRKELKVEDAGIAALFGLECFAWFCAGEIVGRGFTFTGYYV
ncbi:hypothetical protein GmHk_05G014476 [Glycine max]|nr:hypothetical protein GmHk_05G014476 [Glycine max]